MDSINQLLKSGGENTRLFHEIGIEKLFNEFSGNLLQTIYDKESNKGKILENIIKTIEQFLNIFVGPNSVKQILVCEQCKYEKFLHEIIVLMLKGVDIFYRHTEKFGHKVEFSLFYIIYSRCILRISKVKCSFESSTIHVIKQLKHFSAAKDDDSSFYTKFIRDFNNKMEKIIRKNENFVSFSLLFEFFFI